MKLKLKPKVEIFQSGGLKVEIKVEIVEITSYHMILYNTK